MPFPVLQSLFDPLLPPGLQWYWRADFVKEFTSDAIAKHLEQASKTPPGLSQVHIYPIDGAAHRVGKDHTAFTGNVVPMSAPEYTRKSPSGDHTGSREYSWTRGTGAPSSEMRKRCGVPSTFAADVIDCPSGVHAGAPRSSSDSLTTRAFVPSAFMMYSSVLPRCSTEKTTLCPSDASSGPPMIRVSGALHSSVAAPSASFQSPSLVPFDETYSR